MRTTKAEDISPYIVKPGLILRAKCKGKNNVICSGKLVCINKGFGSF
jgi:hypothetical protein